VSLGRNSLETLVLLEPDYIKLDRSYARGLASDRARVRSLARVLKLAESLGTDVVAEGVESPTDLGALKAAGVRFAQGFLWGKPAAGIDAFRQIMPESLQSIA
jgi:EAL domain-containing protein (putative c-di-GMP-specific phosphodiesterase class I)